MFRSTTLFLFFPIVLWSGCICDQNLQVEEPFFSQSIVHPNLNSDSAFDPRPFIPYIPTVNPSAHIQTNFQCQCGVHDYMEEVNVNHQLLQERNATQKKNAFGQSFEPFVVPGNVTDVNQYPFIAALIYRLANGSATHFCGGTLITSKLILTATHCLQGKSAEKTEIWLNERDLLLSTETSYPTIKLKAKKFIPHPEFNPLMNFNDISLIELSEVVDISQSYLRPICLPTIETYEPLDYAEIGITAGWGQIAFDGPKSDRLRHVDVPLIENKACNEESEPYYRGRVTTHMICAGDLMKGGRDACPGDSGGPLFIKHGRGFKLIGVVSFGERCSLPRRPGVYTRVSRYLRWINKIDSETKLSTRCSDESLTNQEVSTT